MLTKIMMLTIMENTWKTSLKNKLQCCFSAEDIARNIRKGLEKSSYKTVLNLYDSFIRLSK